MLYKSRPGFFIWGGITAFISFILSFGLYGATHSLPYALLPFIVLVPGSAALIITGVIVNSRIKRENDRLRRDHGSSLFETTCIRCGRSVTGGFNSFQRHKKYPEGFVYCPYCKVPLSKNLFSEQSYTGSGETED